MSDITNAYKSKFTGAEIDEAVERVKNGSGSGAAVLYTAQTLTAAQQEQARGNIGAVSLETFNAALGEVEAALAEMDEVIG